MSSDGRLQASMSDVSLSESWADAQADTPTVRSDSEDTLSNLSFDNDVVNVMKPIIKLNEECLQIELPPGIVYEPPTVDFPTSPSQLKIAQGEAFMPKEEVAPPDEDVSFASSCRATLDLNGGGVRLSKRATMHHDSLPSDNLDDYIEDFFLPLTNESVMSRQTSFRRKVKNLTESVEKETVFQEISKMDEMLEEYGEEGQELENEEPDSLILPSFVLKNEVEPHVDNFTEPLDYFLPAETLQKLNSVFESINFNNLYTLSGELKHLLSPGEIEEILLNKENLKGLEQIVEALAIDGQDLNANYRKKIQPGSEIGGKYIEEVEKVAEQCIEQPDGTFLIRRDSKRFKPDRICQGIFVESASPGTLRKISIDENLYSKFVQIELGDAEATIPPKKKIEIEDGLLSTGSELEDTSQATQADVFYSMILSREDETDETLDNSDDMEDSILGNLDSIGITTPAAIDPMPMNFLPFRLGSSHLQIDLKAIQPYRRVLSHGGYFDVEKNIALIVFSGCYLPDRSRPEYGYLMDHLFLYTLSTLEELIVQDYVLIYLHGATPKSCQPTLTWLKRCYQLINRKLRKNLKGLYLVHPSFWLRTVVICSRPFVSSKFTKKVQFVNTLAELCLEIPTEHLGIPECVLQHDFELKCSELKRQKQI